MQCLDTFMTEISGKLELLAWKDKDEGPPLQEMAKQQRDRWFIHRLLGQVNTILKEQHNYNSFTYVCVCIHTYIKSQTQTHTPNPPNSSAFL